MIIIPTIARIKCGTNIQIGPILSGSKQKTKKPNGKNTRTSAIEAHHTPDDKSKMIICNRMAKSMNTKHCFASDGVGRVAPATSCYACCIIPAAALEGGFVALKEREPAPGC